MRGSLLMALGLTVFWIGWLLAWPGEMLKRAGELLCDYERD